MEMEVYGRMVTLDKSTELLVKFAKLRISDDPRCFERSTYQKVLDVVKKKGNSGTSSGPMGQKLDWVLGEKFNSSLLE